MTTKVCHQHHDKESQKLFPLYIYLKILYWFMRVTTSSSRDRCSCFCQKLQRFTASHFTHFFLLHSDFKPLKFHILAKTKSKQSYIINHKSPECATETCITIIHTHTHSYTSIHTHTHSSRRFKWLYYKHMAMGMEYLCRSVKISGEGSIKSFCLKFFFCANLTFKRKHRSPTLTSETCLF